MKEAEQCRPETEFKKANKKANMCAAFARELAAVEFLRPARKGLAGT